MKRRKMVVEWLYKRRDLFIQSSQLFWWCVCYIRVITLCEQSHATPSIVSLSEAKQDQQRADLRHVVAVTLHLERQVHVLHSLHLHLLQSCHRQRPRLSVTPSPLPHVDAM